MDEVIIIHVVPEHYDEPSLTRVFRFEFENAQAIEASLGWLREQAIAGGQMSED